MTNEPAIYQIMREAMKDDDSQARITVFDLSRALQGRVAWDIERTIKAMDKRAARKLFRTIVKSRVTGAYREVETWLYANIPISEGA
jgi:predicted RNA-binding protein YlxR (DUF448 family)